VRLRRVLVPLLVPVLLAGACSSGDDGPKAPPGVSEQSLGPLDLQLVGADVVSPLRPMAPLDPATADAVLEAVQAAFDATVVEPLREGVLGDVAGTFTTDAAQRAVFVDAGAIIDAGLGKPSPIKLERGDVQLTALAGEDDQLAVVAARIDWDVSSPARDLRIRRSGELTLVPAFGHWFVGAYTVFTERTVGGETTTTTAVSG
jgi:hypothetical protein